MKKILIIACVLLVSNTMMAQDSKIIKDSKSFITVNAGPSFPAGAFGSRDINNVDAGFAKTGISLNLTYGYQFDKNVAVVAGIVFNRNNVDKASSGVKDLNGQEIVVNLDHWQFYGISAGPMISVKLNKTIALDLRAMIGAVNANEPQISYQGQKLTKEYWNMAALLQGGLNFRIDAGKNIFFYAGADYMYLKPTFKYDFTGIVASLGSSDYFKQKMTLINTTAGIGYKF